MKKADLVAFGRSSGARGATAVSSQAERKGTTGFIGRTVYLGKGDGSKPSGSNPWISTAALTS